MKRDGKGLTELRNGNGTAHNSASKRGRQKKGPKILELAGKVDLSFTVEELIMLRKRDLRFHNHGQKG